MVLALVVVATWLRHRKAADGELELIGSIASVEKTLEPEGSVLVHGELWCARSRTSESLACGRNNVRIIGATGHLLEVEPLR